MLAFTGPQPQAAGQDLYISSVDPGTGVYGGAAYTVSGDETWNNVLVGNGPAGGNATGSITQNSGTTMTLSGALTLASTASSTGSFDLNGGTLTLNQILGGAGASTFNFNGGTLRATADQTQFFQGVTTISVRNGAARIDTNGFNVTIPQALVHSTVSGDNAFDGGLVKSGAGTLTLTGTNTFTRATTMSGGTLTLADSGSLKNGGVLFAGAGSTVNLTGNSTMNAGSFSFVASNCTVNVTDHASITTGGPLDMTSVSSRMTISSNASVGFTSTSVQGVLSVTGNASLTSAILSITTNGVLTVTDSATVNTGSTLLVSGSLNLRGGTLSSPSATVNTGYGLFSQSGGTFNAGTSLSIAGPLSAYYLNGGTLNAGALSVNGTPSPAIFNLYNGTVNLTGALTVGTQPTNNASTTGNYYLTGGGLNVGSGGTTVGANGAETGTFYQSGGTHSTPSLLVGGNRGTGGYTLNGGNLIVAGGDAVGSGGGTGTFTQGGGTHSAPLVTVGGDSGSTGVYNLNGGTLAVGNVTGGAGASTVNFSGGTIQVSGNQPALLQGINTVTVRNGGAGIDTNGFNVTPAVVLQHSSASGDNAVDGGLAKYGAGTLTLPLANTYNGPTTVNAGLLLVQNTAGSATGAGDVTVNDGGTLGGKGVLAGAVTVNTGGTLAPGAAAISALRVGGALTLQSGSTLAINLGGTVRGTGYDQVRAGGALTLAGTLNVQTVNGFTLVVNQTFTILDSTSDTAATVGEFSNAPGALYTNAAGQTFSVNYAADADGGLVPNDVTLTYLGTTVVPEPSTWTLLALGTLGLIFIPRRRSRAA